MKSCPSRSGTCVDKVASHPRHRQQIDHGNGEGALNLGLYLFPRLFVSHEVGLFDNGNVTNARYELSDSWNVTLESGQRDCAVQINWRKNRD